MYGIVTSILTDDFPVQNGYVTFQYVGNQRRCFLMTQCKAPGEERKENVWEASRTPTAERLPCHRAWTSTPESEAQGLWHGREWIACPVL